jgi:hypothetical protein
VKQQALGVDPTCIVRQYADGSVDVLDEDDRVVHIAAPPHDLSNEVAEPVTAVRGRPGTIMPRRPRESRARRRRTATIAHGAPDRPRPSSEPPLAGKQWGSSGVAA